MGNDQKGVVVDSGFFVREAEHAVGSFFAPIRGAYEAVRASVDGFQPSDRERKVGAGLARHRRRSERKVQG